MAVKLGYLIDPFQEVVDYNGLPIVGARIYVYKADTSIPVETYSDFLDHRNDWPVIADTLGNATVIAPYDQLYDIVIKNAQGELVMSKKRVSPHEAQGVDPTPVPDDNQYWIGTDGAIVQVTPDLQGTIIPLAEESDADQHFIHEITSDGRMILEDGLYLIQCVIDIRQDPADLHNTIENLIVMTGISDPEDVIFERDEAGPDSSYNTHSLKLSFIRHAQASEYTNELYFKIRTPVALAKAQNRRLSIVKLQSSVSESGGGGSYSGEYTGGQYIYISPERVISVVGIDPDSYATHNEVSGVSASLREIINNVSGDIPDMSQYITQQYFTENTSAFLTSADMSSYATNEYVNNYVTQNTSGLQEKLVFGYDEDDKINSINGSALAGEGGGAYYSAGPGIQIEHDVISVSGVQMESDMSAYLRNDEYTEPVQSDWSETDTGDLAFIKNKPDIPSLDGYATEEYVIEHTSGLQEKLTFGYDEDDKINAINGSAIGGTGGTFTQVQSDWTQSATSAVDFIKNKPNQSSLQAGTGIAITKVGNDYVISSSGGSVDPSELSAYATKTYVLQATSGKLDTSAYTAPVQSDWNQTNSDALDYIKNKPDMSSYATQTWTQNLVTSATSGKLDTSAYQAPTQYQAGYYIDIDQNNHINVDPVSDLVADEGVNLYQDSANNVHIGLNIPTLVVGTVAEASGTNILYIVSGSN